MQIVGIMGPMGSGKSTAALHLVEAHGFIRMSMADPLKAALRGMGIPLELEANRELRDVPQELLCGKSWRHLAQTMGTEWGRVMVGGDLWVNLLRARLQALPVGTKVVIDDVRFPNEVEMIRALGGSIWLVTRPDLVDEPPLWKQVLEALSFGLFKAEHPSESYWRRVAAGIEIDNYSSPEAFKATVSWALSTAGP